MSIEKAGGVLTPKNVDIVIKRIEATYFDLLIRALITQVFFYTFKDLRSNKTNTNADYKHQSYYGGIYRTGLFFTLTSIDEGTSSLQTTYFGSV